MRWRFARSGEGGEVLAVRAVDTATCRRSSSAGECSPASRPRALDAAESEGVAFVFQHAERAESPRLPQARVAPARGPEAAGAGPASDRLLRAAASRDLGSGAATAPPAGSQLVPAEEFFADPASVAPFARAQPAPGRLSTPRWEGYLRWRYAAGPLPYAGFAEGSPPAAVRDRPVAEPRIPSGRRSCARPCASPARRAHSAGCSAGSRPPREPITPSRTSTTEWPAARVLSRAGYLPPPARRDALRRAARSRRRIRIRSRTRRGA
jgi:hypothetical protein